MNLWNAWKVWGIFSTLENEAEGKTMDNGTVTPGWKTSEFWLHIAAQIPTVAALLLGASNPVVLGLTAACALGSAIYTISRSNVKVTALTAAAQAAADSLNSAPQAAPTAAPATPAK